MATPNNNLFSRCVLFCKTSTGLVNAVGVKDKAPRSCSFIQDLGHSAVIVFSGGVAMLEGLRERVCRHESVDKVVLQSCASALSVK